MSITLAVTMASAMADAITTAVDAGSGAGTLAVYTGAKPADPQTAPTGTLLATFTLADPAAAAAAAGVATWDMTTPPTATVEADGTPGWFRAADSDGNAVYDAEVATAGSDMNFDSVTWVAGGTVKLNSGNVTQPTS